jgi:low temperature requirement protein LtrA
VAATTRVVNSLTRLAGHATPFELLFDLVFVFTLTQVTQLITQSPDALTVLKALIVLALVYCMYDGYIWLMNQAPPDGAVTRIILLGAMAGFLIVAAAIPTAFGTGRWIFSITFLALMLIHHILFITDGSPTNVGGILRTGPFNLAAAIILVVAAALGNSAAIWLFPLALAVILATGLVNSRGGFNLGASHLIERHRLLMIIAFGESIVNVGATLTSHILIPLSFVNSVLAVGIVGELWWTYFSAGDLAKTEHRVEERDVVRRSNLAITSFYGEHLGMMFGLVLFAAGSGLLIGSVDRDHGIAAGLITGGGVAIFLFSQALYRFELKLGNVVLRLAAGLLAVGVTAASLVVNSAAEFALLLVLVAAVVAWAPLAERLTSRRTRLVAVKRRHAHHAERTGDDK